jgi:hypothetical protein
MSEQARRTRPKSSLKSKTSPVAPVSDPTECVLDIPWGGKGKCVDIDVWLGHEDLFRAALERGGGEEALLKHLRNFGVRGLLETDAMLRGALLRQQDMERICRALRHGSSAECVGLLLAMAVFRALVASTLIADVDRDWRRLSRHRAIVESMVRPRSMSQSRIDTAEAFLKLLDETGKEARALERLVLEPGEWDKDYAKEYRNSKPRNYEGLRNHVRAILRDYRKHLCRRAIDQEAI